MAYPNDSNTVLLLHFETANDTSVGGNGGSTHGAYTAEGGAGASEGAYKFGGWSLVGDGDGDYIHFADHDDWNFGTGALTIDFWWKPVTDVQQALIGQYDDANNFWTLMYYRLGETRRLWFDVHSTTELLSMYGELYEAYFPMNTWYHIALIRGFEGSANYWAITVNGILLKGQVGAITMPDLSSDLYIGQRGNSTDYLNGYIDELRISKGVARWIAAFDPPTIPYPDTARWMGKVNNITNPAKLNAIALTGASKINQVATRGA